MCNLNEHLRLAFYISGVTVAPALIAACSGAGSTSSALAPSTGMNPSAVGQVLSLKESMTLTARIFKPVHKDHRKSWISPEARRARRLLFISEYTTGDINIYTLPNLVLEGQITGFDEPDGMCSDPSGNIWVVNQGKNRVMKLSHSGSLLRSLSDPTGRPAGCAVNRANNDLAVTNVVGTSGSYGNVLVYAHSRGKPQQFANPSVTQYFYPAYDDAGNLYVNGMGNSGYALTELAAGSSTLSTVSISGGALAFPGGMNWNSSSHTLVLGDQDCNFQFTSCLYSATVSDGVATITGVTNLLGPLGLASGFVVQTAIGPQGRLVAGGFSPDDSTYSGPSSVDRWAFTAGGVPTNFNNTGVDEDPVGAAISNK